MSLPTPTVIAPGATIGIIGGGQLGRMLAIAAARLGYKSHVLDPDPDCCAADVAAVHTIAEYDDRAALAAFARVVEVVTFEFENIDADPLDTVADIVAIHPPLSALRVAQDRIAEKHFAEAQGGRTARWAAASTREDLDTALATVGTPSILKTTRFGYDGKGQARLAGLDDADRAWAEIGGGPAILEGLVPFDREFSILVARRSDGACVVWDAPENVHRDGILATSTVPAHPDIAAHAAEARALAVRMADALEYVGVMAVEFFAGTDGAVFNEMAPRVHNSGHWTIEGSVTCQFENHIRAICGLPLGSTALITGSAVMTNLIGDEIDAWPTLLAEPGAHLHLYGKGEARPGRKMGHVTRLR